MFLFRMPVVFACSSHAQRAAVVSQQCSARACKRAGARCDRPEEWAAVQVASGGGGEETLAGMAGRPRDRGEGASRVLARLVHRPV